MWPTGLEEGREREKEGRRERDREGGRERDRDGGRDRKKKKIGRVTTSIGSNYNAPCEW